MKESLNTNSIIEVKEIINESRVGSWDILFVFITHQKGMSHYLVYNFRCAKCVIISVLKILFFLIFLERFIGVTSFFFV